MSRTVKTIKRYTATSTENSSSSNAAPIWTIRPVEWPFKLQSSVFAKCLKSCRMQGQSLGIPLAAASSQQQAQQQQTTTASTDTPSNPNEPESTATNTTPSATPTSTGGGMAENSYFSGLMSRVLLNNPAAGGTAGAGGSDAEWLEAEQTLERQNNSFQTLRAPRCVAAANGWIVGVSEIPIGSSLLRLISKWNVRRTVNDQVWIALPPPVVDATSSSSTRIQHVFVDPTANHIVVSAANGEAYYYTSTSNAAASKLPGFGRSADGSWGLQLTGVPATSHPQVDKNTVQRGISANSYVTAIAWDKERGTEGSTKTILLGTSKGEIYEYALSINNISNPSLPTLLHKLSNDTAVTGLYWERLRTTILVVAATAGRQAPTRLTTFVGTNSLASTLGTPAVTRELPGSVPHAALAVTHDHMALRTATGLFTARIHRAAVSATAVLVDVGLLRVDNALSVAVTPHHWIIWNDQSEICCWNRVSQQMIQKEVIESPEGGEVEFLMDVRRPDQVWLRKGRSLLHLSSSQEDRDVWKFTLQKCLSMHDEEDGKAHEALFESAKTQCSVASQKAVVTAVRAEYHLKFGRGELAAKYLAQCPPSLEPFSDTAIRLALPKLGIDDPQSYGYSDKAHECLASSNLPLIAYLNDKMRIGSSNDDKMTCTMLGAWLTELFLHERETSGLLTQFLNANVSTMDAKTILKILTSHDVKASDCASYAAVSGDVATAVHAAIGSADSRDTIGVLDALRILNEASFVLAEPLYYKYASMFLSRAPAAVGESFLVRYADGLSPMRLLPAIMRYEKVRSARSKEDTAGSTAAEESKTVDPDVRYSIRDPSASSDGFELKIESGINTASFVDDSTVSIRYLEGVIKQGCRSGAVFRYLMSLYTEMLDEEPLYEFLSTHVAGTTTVADAAKKAMLSGDRSSFNDDTSSTPLDMSFALRAVLATGRHFRSAIKLYMGFDMRQQAVELALKVDPSLAQHLAQGSVETEERKRLWLMIAKSAATDGTARGGKDVVARVVSVLKDCGPDVLSIEDVLPFLPDFAQIDQIKDEICEALTSYSSKIEGYLREMSDCDRRCDAVRKEIGRLRSHTMRLRTDAKCAISNQRIISGGEPFYAFPSGYVMLSTPLKEHVLPSLKERQRSRVQELERSLRLGGNEKQLEQVQNELDGIVAAECPFTGSLMIDSIDKCFDVEENKARN